MIDTTQEMWTQNQHGSADGRDKHTEACFDKLMSSLTLSCFRARLLSTFASMWSQAIGSATDKAKSS